MCGRRRVERGEDTSDEDVEHMNEHGEHGDLEWLAAQFEANRGRLTAVAYRMLGSAAEADDAVQESWIRLSRTDAAEIENLNAWLTTVTARVCLNILRSRTTRREEPLDAGPGEPVAADGDPERDAVMADSLGVALLVVLEHLPPAERVAFVLHDMFAVPFDEIAPIVGRTPTAARKLASRARERVQGVEPRASGDQNRRRAVVEAFLAAARSGDIQGLVSVLDPDVVLRADTVDETGAPEQLFGADAVATRVRQRARSLRLAVVDGTFDVAAALPGQPAAALFRFEVVNDRIIAMEVITAPGAVAAHEVVLLD
jgi:RNA polymerase sigma-70 factor (ECF subfamily)